MALFSNFAQYVFLWVDKTEYSVKTGKSVMGIDVVVGFETDSLFEWFRSSERC